MHGGMLPGQRVSEVALVQGYSPRRALATGPPSTISSGIGLDFNGAVLFKGGENVKQGTAIKKENVFESNCYPIMMI